MMYHRNWPTQIQDDQDGRHFQRNMYDVALVKRRGSSELVKHGETLIASILFPTHR